MDDGDTATHEAARRRAIRDVATVLGIIILGASRAAESVAAGYDAAIVTRAFLMGDASERRIVGDAVMARIGETGRAGIEDLAAEMFLRLGLDAAEDS